MMTKAIAKAILDFAKANNAVHSCTLSTLAKKLYCFGTSYFCFG